MPEDWQHAGFGLYIHWPFCQSKCPYCEFNSHVSDRIDQDRWARAYLSEIERVAAETGPRPLNTVFFGGGTPSLMEPELVATILEKVRSVWPAANDCEITLEANPSSIEAGRFRGFRDAGVNRLSMGIQALNDNDLRRLGRLHTVREALAGYEIAADTFARVSFDLIYARQDQTLQDWRSELSAALALSPDHLSLYQLTIEDGTAFGARYAAGRLAGLPNEGLSADLYFLTQELCSASGLEAYEVSNHARTGAESRHNLIYWRYGDYAGIGPGAHGRLTLNGTKFATEAPRLPATWLEQVEHTGCSESSRMPLTGQDQAEESLMMGLRLKEGIDLDRYSRLAGSEINTSKINVLADLGLVKADGSRLIATQQGRIILNAVLADLMAE